MKQLADLMQTKTFKRIYFVVFLILLVYGIFAAFDPSPFLRFGYLGVFIFNGIGGMGTYLIPSLSQKMNLYYLSLATALGMAINDSISWVVGRGGTAVVNKGKWIIRIENLIKKNAFWTFFIISIIPFPYDAIGLAAGYLSIKYENFFLPTFLGKFIRMILIGLGTRMFL